MRYAFYISGNSGRLFKFISRYKNQIDMNDIILVFSDKEIPSNLRILIKNNNINLIEFDYQKVPDNKNLALSDRLLEELKGRRIDYCFSFGSHILCGDILKEYENRIINFHPAILPMFPGLNAIDKAIIQGNVFLLGNTAHFIDKGTDTGPIIMQSVIPIQSFLTTRDYDVILDIQLEMLKKLISVLNQDRLVFIDGKPIIKEADYSKSIIFPVV